MNKTHLIVTALILWLATSISLLAQNNLTLKGTIISNLNQPIPFASIAIKGTNMGVLTKPNGTFSLTTQTKLPFTLAVSCIGYTAQEIIISTESQAKAALNIALETKSEDIDAVQIIGKGGHDESFQKLNSKNVALLPDASGGNIEALVKTQMGVSSNNELSSQYRVRGGNYDENSIYVNDVEIYRPFLVRSGQQEGLSFVNPDLVKDISFSAGGFDAKYNDKMSSVLDISYKKPQNFAGSASASLLGGTVHAEGASKNKKFTAIFGSRYKTNRILLASLDTKGEYDPRFFDFQTYLTYQISPKLELGILGYFGQTNYNFAPVTRTTNFGTISDMKVITIYFDGQEKDQFASALGALSLTYSPNINNKFKLTTSTYNTIETENFDIVGSYYLNTSEGSGTQTGNPADTASYVNHARNDLNGTVTNISLKGTHILNDHKITWESKFQYEHFKENISEWNYIDSAGYSLPYNGQTIELMHSYKANLNTSSNRITAFVQDDYQIPTQRGKLTVTGGLRGNLWSFNNELLISPRAAIMYEPDWKRHFQFRFATGLYYQSPFYKELHSPSGEINYNIKAQQSIHFILTSNYFFEASNRPFKLSAELYYKSLSKLIPYNIDNVRIKYLGENNAKGYAMGLDLKLNGELTEGLESWATISLMKTEENLTNDVEQVQNNDGTYTTNYPGYIPRPSDQRVNFSLFFQDYIPRYPSFKVHLNLLFGTGLPFGPPDSPRYKATLRMPPYRRIDLGFSKELTGSLLDPNKALGPFKKLWIGLDVFNLFDISNTISYYWITDVNAQQYAVPNYLTTRQINVKLVANF